MLLWTEWDGRPRMFSARSHDVRTDSSEVRALRIEARYFPIRPDLTHSISILIYFFFAKCWKLRTFRCRTCMHSKEERDWTAAKKIQQWKLIFFSLSRNEILQLIEERDSFPRLFYSELESTISIGVHGKCKRVVSVQNLTACSGPALVKPSGPAHISYHGIACWRS